MQPQGKKLAFIISYRREGSSAHARSLRDSIETASGAESVFMDVEQLRMGARWPSVIVMTLSRNDC
jgi:hypothetical protein